MTEQTPAPVDPRSMTQEQAGAFLAALKTKYDARNAPGSESPTQKLADPGFREKYLAGDREAKAEIKALIEGKISADGDAARVDAAMNGTLAPGFYTNSPSGISPSNMASMARDMRELGHTDDQIRGTLLREPLSPENHAVVLQHDRAMLKSPEFLQALNRGDAEAVRQVTLVSRYKYRGKKG
jgi:hypothetical protein